MDIFQKATRLKLRFDLNGQISTEQLWDANIDALTTYEEQLTEAVEAFGKSIRRKATTKTKAQELQELRLQVVTSVLDIRIKEQEDAKTAADTKAHNARIMELIARKQEEQLQGKSLEELEAMLKK